MTKLSQREIDVCHRLRAFRETTKISRSKFALEVGVSSDRLASYEFARAPVRYDVYRAIQQRFFINPFWLGTGEYAPDYERVFDDSEFVHLINQRSLFTEVYDLHFSKIIVRLNASATQRGRNTMAELQEVFADKSKMMEFFKSDPVFAKQCFNILKTYLGALDRSISKTQKVNRALRRIEKGK